MSSYLAFAVRIGNCMVHSKAVIGFGDNFCADCLRDWHWDAATRLNGMIERNRKVAERLSDPDSGDQRG